MPLPFTPAQFFEVFTQYNQRVWPLPLLLNAAALGCIVMCFAPMQ